MLENKNRYDLTKYWLVQQFPLQIVTNLQEGGTKKKKWTTLKHNGVLFPPPYVPHNIPLLYDGIPIILTPDAEEIATMYAKHLEGEYIKDKVFNKNFWKDFKKYLDPTIKDFEKCNFELIRQHILKKKEIVISKEEKEKNKIIRESYEAPYKIATIDNKQEVVGNFRVEPPNIFIGRGCHPKLGKIKPRLYPKDIIINIGKGEPIPIPNIEGKWKKVIHDNMVEWLASWSDPISGKAKYVWLGSQSSFKAESDLNKFELARKLRKKIKKIREENNIKLTSPNIKDRQIATALYFIDNLALRVGNEKGSDEADTVGVTSLRVEHVKLGEKLSISLDFLGKDSIRYIRNITVTNDVYNNLQDFMATKSSTADLFDKITSSDLNKYLQEFMKNLTAKVFRTYNASYLFQKELLKASTKFDTTLDDISKINFLYDEYNKANAKVALLCNHQKKITESFNSQLDKISIQIKELKKKAKAQTDKAKKLKIKNKIKTLISKREVKTELKGVSLETSKTNYIDPRITIAFMKKHNMPIDKLFSKTLQEKFWWAFDVDQDFKF